MKPIENLVCSTSTSLFRRVPLQFTVRKASFKAICCVLRLGPCALAIFLSVSIFFIMIAPRPLPDPKIEGELMAFSTSFMWLSSINQLSSASTLAFGQLMILGGDLLLWLDPCGYDASKQGS